MPYTPFLFLIRTLCMVILQPSPELLYGVMLLPDRDCFRCSQLSSENHNTLNLRAIKKEHQYRFAERRAFCFFSNCRFTSPSTLLKLDVFLMCRKLLFLAIYIENIVALSMNQYSIKAFFFKYLNKVISAPLSREYIRTIPAIEGDRKLSQVNPLLLEQLHHRMDHLTEYLWLRCVTSALFANRSNTKRDDPLTYLDSNGDDVLTFHHMMMLSRKPAICKAYVFPHPVYDSIINTEGNPHSRECRWTFGKCITYQLFCFGESSMEEQFPDEINAPGVDSIINFVFVNAECLNELVRSEYIEDMSTSQHQQNLDRFLRFLFTLSKVSVEKLLK